MNESLNLSAEQKQSDSEMNQWEKMAQEVLSEQPRESIEKIEPHANESDQTIDRVFDRLGRDVGDGYFEDSNKLAGLVGDAIKMTSQEAVNNFKSNIESYKARSTESYQIRAMTFYEQTKQNIQELSKQGLVGNDTIKVFLNPDYISGVGRGRMMSEYNALQSDFSRQEEESWLTGTQNYERYSMRVKEMADAFAENGGDVAYQADVPEADTFYDPNKPVIPGSFIHVNSNKPREKGGLRCYITTDKTTDPSAALYAWKGSVQDSPLKDSLYFKFSTSIDYKDGRKQRPDDIIIYKTDNIDDAQFKNLLQDFQHRCNEMSPDLLPHDDKKMPATTQKIANGISIAGEPSYVNDYMRYTDRKEGKYSWTTFVDKMALLSTSVAANRLGIQPDSINTPGLEDETKKVFREFMLLSKINPDTMLPIEYGDSLPSWAKLENEPVSEQKP